MPILEIDGVGDVEVDDSFTKLSAADQNAFVQQIIQQAKSGSKQGKFAPQEPGAFDLGYLGGQFKRGLGSAIEGYAKTAKVLGADAQNTQSFEQMGQNLQQGAPRSAMDRFSNPGANDVTFGGKSLSALPGAIAEGGAGLLADLGAMVAGNAVAPGVGIAAPIVSYGAREYGRQLEERQANNGGAPASGADQAAVGASVVAQGALNRLGLGKIAPGIPMGAGTVLDPLKRIGAATGVEGVTSAGQEALSQAGTTIGTKDGKFEGERILDAGLIGGAVGGTVRTTAEAARLPKVALGEIAKRGYDFQEELPNVTGRLAQVSQEQGRKMGNRFDDGQTLKEVADEIHSMRKATDGLNAYAKEAIEAAFRRGEIDETTHANAKLALNEQAPTKGQIKTLEEVVSKLPEGGKQELQGAVQLAKRAATVEQIKTKANFQEGKQTLFKGKVPYVSGGTSRVATVLTDRAKALLMGAAGGGLTYAGLQGLGSLGATTVAVSKVAPVVAGMVGAYQGTKLLDKALGTYSPVKQIVESSAPRDLKVGALGGDLPSIRQERIDEEARVQTEREQAQAAREQEKADREQQRADKAAAREQAKAERAQTKADNDAAMDREALTIQAGGANKAQEKTLSTQAKALADAIRKLDEKNGVPADEAKYAEIESMRDPDFLPQALERVNADLKALGKKAATKKEAEQKAPKAEKPPKQDTAEETQRESMAIQTGRANMAQEQQLAKKAKAIADMQREIDKKNGVAPDEQRYQVLESIRDPDILAGAQERLKPEPVKTKAKAKKTDAPKGPEKPPAEPPAPAKEVSRPKGANTTLKLAIDDIVKSAPKKEQTAVRNKLNSILTKNMTIEKARQIISAVSTEHPSVSRKAKARLDNEKLSLLETQLRDPKSKTVEFTTKEDPRAANYSKPKYNEAARVNQSIKIDKAFDAVMKRVPKDSKSAATKLQERFKNEGWGTRRRELIDEFKKLVSDKDAKAVEKRLAPLLKNPRNNPGGATKYPNEKSYMNAKNRVRKEDADS